MLRRVPKAHLPPALIFLRSSSIALSRTPRPLMVAFVLFSSRPSCEILCSLTGIPDYIARRSMRSDCPACSEQLTSASSKAITFSSSISESISTLYACPRSFTNVSRIDECGGIVLDRTSTSLIKSVQSFPGPDHRHRPLPLPTRCAGDKCELRANASAIKPASRLAHLQARAACTNVR
jgi:hypothetical protein